MLLRQRQQLSPIAPRDVPPEDFRLGPADRPKLGVADRNAFELPGDGREIVRLAPVDPGFLDQLLACKPGFFLPVRVLSRLFRRLFLEGLAGLHKAGRLAFFGDIAPLADASAFDATLAPLRRCEWVIYAKRPFAGPKAVLAYLSRYTHRVAISNSRLIRLDDKGVTFQWKDYRARGKAPGKAWIKPMTLEADEFIRRFLLHVLPSGFHRIRH